MEFMKSEAGEWAWDWQRLPRCHSLQLHAAVANPGSLPTLLHLT